jgi:hypothetical protein
MQARGPPNNEIKQKPAMARMTRSSLLISVFGGLCGGPADRFLGSHRDHDGDDDVMTHRVSSPVIVFTLVLVIHIVLQWLAWPAHPGHTVGRVVLPWWPTVWQIVTVPAAWLTRDELATSWQLIALNGVFWACIAAGVSRVLKAQLASRRVA